MRGARRRPVFLHSQLLGGHPLGERRRAPLANPKPTRNRARPTELLLPLTNSVVAVEILRMLGTGLVWFQGLVLSLAFGATALFLHRVVNKNEAISAAAHWGGLGGGTSGWRVTPALASLLAAVVLWILGSALSVYAFSVQHSDSVAATKRENDVKDAETKRKNDLEDARIKLANEREDAWMLREERHREQERAERSGKSALPPSASAAPQKDAPNKPTHLAPTP
jgi:hypothetical protein